MKKLLALVCISSLLCTMTLPVSSAEPKTREAQIFDALEILKYCVDMPNNAAQLMGKDDLSVFDALEILKGMVRMRAPVMVNVLKDPDDVSEQPVNPVKEEIDFQIMGYTYTRETLYQINAARSLNELNDVFAITQSYNDSGPYFFLAFPDIDESFFEEKAIVVVYTTVSDGGVIPVIDSLVKEQNNLTAYSTRGRRPGGFLALEGIRIVLSVNRSDIEGVEQFSEVRNPEMQFCYQDYPEHNICCINGTCYPIEDYENWFINWFESKYPAPKREFTLGEVYVKLNEKYTGDNIAELFPELDIEGTLDWYESMYESRYGSEPPIYPGGNRERLYNLIGFKYTIMLTDKTEENTIKAVELLSGNPYVSEANFAYIERPLNQ